MQLLAGASPPARLGRLYRCTPGETFRRHAPASVLEKIRPSLGDGVHDTDLMLWMTGGRIESAYAMHA